MGKTLEMPAVASEAEEAKWWFDNRHRLLDEFQQAAADGTLQRGTLMKRGLLTPTTTIRLDPNDIEMARTQAEERGSSIRLTSRCSSIKRFWLKHKSETSSERLSGDKQHYAIVSPAASYSQRCIRLSRCSVYFGRGLGDLGIELSEPYRGTCARS